MPNVPISARVLMGGRDVTRYVTALSVTQPPRQLHREWTLTLAGWTHVDPAAKWDIFVGYGGGGEVLVRQGVIPPDWQPTITVGPHSAVPGLEISGVDWAWVAARVRRPDTIVVAPDHRQARRAIARFEDRHERRPIGRVTILTAATMHAAVQQLGALAGFAVVPLLPDYKLQGHVCDPHDAIWDAIWRLVAPFAPVALFRRERNEVVIADRPLLARAQTEIAIGESMITELRIEPVRDGYIRRVLVRIPAWMDVATPS